MDALLPPWSLLAAFVGASLVLAVTPGPGVLYVVTRSVADGRRAGLASVAGVALGNLVNAVGASIGLGALFAVSPAAFALVRYAGAAYLVWLGIRSLRAAEVSSESPARRGAAAVLREGFTVAITNPKTTLFFAAFLPQFLLPGTSPALRSVLLGAIFVAIAAATDSAYALAAGAIAPSFGRLRGVRTIGRSLTAAVFIGLGLLAAFAGSG